VRSPFDRVPEETLVRTVEAVWRLDISAFRYFPHGAGAYHWTAEATDGTRWFVTCDDLDTKPWLGERRDIVFDRLRAAYETAADLRAGGSAFVAGAVRAPTGEVAARLDDRHSVSVFEHLDGEPGQWGRTPVDRVRDDLLSVLARLHRAPAPERGLLRRGLEVAGRAGLEGALRDVGRRWVAGPLAEPLRSLLATHTEQIRRWLDDLDAAAARAGDDADRDVLTHGEPHPGNLLLTPAGVVLVDWDTVAVAPPERDLWMIAAADATVPDAYRELTGTSLDAGLLAAYRLVWALDDIAAYTEQLRTEHDRDADAERALAAVASILEGPEPAPYRKAAHA
jgi:spectinomycin phosphotransferase